VRNIPDEIYDINPKSWMSRYKKRSLPYLIKMGIFYLVIGLGLQHMGNSLVEHFISGYQAPSMPISITMGLSAGPIEEGIFFGTPFYTSGNYLAVLVGGIIWSMLHIFNTNNFIPTSLPYGSIFFTIPHIFFSLRTWISGKGWFAILFHSSWNAFVLGIQCTQGSNCIAIGKGLYFFLDILGIAATIILSIALYRMYRRGIIHKNI
jgi:hypothetical protein